MQEEYSIILQLLHVPSDPDDELLKRLVNVFKEKHILKTQLLIYKPRNINLSALVDVLETLKTLGTSDEHIKKFLATDAVTWKGEATRNQDANIDPTTSQKRVTWE